jgi:hypothetical protein
VAMCGRKIEKGKGNGESERVVGNGERIRESESKGNRERLCVFVSFFVCLGIRT